MDNFAEQLVKKELTSSDKIKKYILYGGGILLTVLFVVLSFLMLGTMWMMIGLLLAMASGYGTFFMGRNMYIEYEYTFTNGELDIDKIIAKSKRKPLITADVRKFISIGKYSNDMEETSDMTVVISSDNIASHEYYADFQHSDYGSVRLIFSPDERMLDAIRRSLPAKIRNQI